MCKKRYVEYRGRELHIYNNNKETKSVVKERARVTSGDAGIVLVAMETSAMYL